MDTGKAKEQMRNYVRLQLLCQNTKTNSETIFGHLDRIVREKPNVSMIVNEAYITEHWIGYKGKVKKREVLY